ncbi:hypothetical protein Tco_1272262 [Tanacetum coccineum]
MAWMGWNTDIKDGVSELLINCHGHGLTKGNIIKIFYHGLDETTQEALNVVTGDIFLYKTPNQAYQLLEDKVLLKLDWAKNQKPKTHVRKTISFTYEGNNNSDTDKIMVRMDAMAIKLDCSVQEMKSRTESLNLRLFVDKQSARPSGSLQSNTQPNHGGSSSKSYQHHIHKKCDDEDEEPTPQPQTPKLNKEAPTPKSYKPRIPYHQRLRKLKIEAQYGKFLDMIRAVRINVPLIDVLAGMPNYAMKAQLLLKTKFNLNLETPKVSLFQIRFLGREPLFVPLVISSHLLYDINTIITLSSSSDKGEWMEIWRMLFGLCNAPATFQRCMLAIFQDMIEESVEVGRTDLVYQSFSYEHVLAIKRVDEYGFVIRRDLVALTSGSVGPFYSINTVPVIKAGFKNLLDLGFSISKADLYRYPVDNKLDSVDSRKSPTTVLFDDDTRRISIRLYEY